MNDTIVVTGGAGFIGSNFILDWLRHEEGEILNLDKLTYAGNAANLVDADPRRYHFAKGDVADMALVDQILRERSPRAVVHFAAESHVDRSICGPEDFIQTNVVGTLRLLRAVHTYWSNLRPSEQEAFRFLHVSTDEVYGSLFDNDPPFSESHRYMPNSPYAASKAASDHLVRAWRETYRLPVLTTNCSNNYGPYQFPEKLIPLMIVRALSGQSLPVYGDGKNVRDWLFVLDHCAALRCVLKAGQVGDVYNIGGNCELSNLEVVGAICALLDDLRPATGGAPYSNLIEFVEDRPGNDRRYAMNAAKIKRELGWQPAQSFAEGLRKTVSWYLENQDWVTNVTSGTYRQWVVRQYDSRGSR